MCVCVCVCCVRNRARSLFGFNSVHMATLISRLIASGVDVQTTSDTIAAARVDRQNICIKCATIHTEIDRLRGGQGENMKSSGPRLSGACVIEFKQKGTHTFRSQGNFALQYTSEIDNRSL